MAAPVGMILAAGFATRLKPLSQLRPKPLMELGGKTIIYHLLKLLEDSGVKDIFINLHYGAEAVQKAVLALPLKASVHFSFEEEILGTGGGLCRVIRKFNLHDTKLVLLHGDILCDIDLRPLYQSQSYCTLVGARGVSLAGYEGGLSTDQDDAIIELGVYYAKAGQKKHSGFFTGIQLLSEAAVNALHHEEGFSLVSDIYPHWLREGRAFSGLMLDFNYEDLGTPQRLHKANMELLQNPHSFVHLHTGAKVGTNKLFIDPRAKIAPGIKLHGPAWILKDAVIDEDVSIGPNALIGEGVRIKKGATISNTVVMRESVIEKNEHLDCMVALLGARVLAY